MVHAKTRYVAFERTVLTVGGGNAKTEVLAAVMPVGSLTVAAFDLGFRDGQSLERKHVADRAAVERFALVGKTVH